MKWVGGVLAMLWGGSLGYAGSQFYQQGDIGMVALTVGLFLSVVYIIYWIITASA